MKQEDESRRQNKTALQFRVLEEGGDWFLKTLKQSEEEIKQTNKTC